MKYLVFFFVVFATARASIIGFAPLPLTTGTVIKGASATGTAIGLDGVVATAVDGATIVELGPRPGIASAVVAPGVLAAPAVVAAAPATSAVIAGPSGAIATSSGGAIGVAPVLTRTVVAAPAVASASAVVAPAVARAVVVNGHGLIL